MSALPCKWVVGQWCFVGKVLSGGLHSPYPAEREGPGSMLLLVLPSLHSGERTSWHGMSAAVWHGSGCGCSQA